MPTLEQQLIAKFQQQDAVIGIIGLGYVGLPLALRYAECGFKVYGFDIDEEKVRQLNAGQSYIGHIDGAAIAKARERGLEATSDYANISLVDAIILCVPTPLNKYREPDISYIETTLTHVKPYLKAGQVLSLESTTYPGTTEEIIVPEVIERGLIVGEDVFVVYSPEREDPGNPNFQTSTIPKVCSGVTAACRAVGIALYEQVVIKVVPLSSTRAAEMTKIVENVHRAVNIGLVNELKMVADKMNIDIHEVIEAAATKPFGFVPYYPGPGIGGHCIPIDPFYLTWKAREFGIHTHFIELAGEINDSMPEWVVDKTRKALNLQEKALKNSRILLLGIAYKCNIDDMRESPSMVLMKLFKEEQAQVDYADPHVPLIPPMRHYPDYHLSSIELTAESLARYDAVIVCTPHDCFNFDLILEHAVLIIDTRGIYRAAHPKVVKA